MADDNHIELTESTETIPASDRRDQLVRELDAMCRDLIQTIHKLEEATRSCNERMIGRLEERIYTMTDDIHSVQRNAYLDEGIQIAIAHTVDGCPIRVSKPRRVNLWGI